jgi:hypothetical protein
LALPPTVLLAQVVKHAKQRRVVGVAQRVVVGNGRAAEHIELLHPDLPQHLHRLDLAQPPPSY